jgi:cell division septation protein DedD
MAQPVDDKELVLGNKQLISLFFVVVALCGVFFAMGYMIGRNSGKATTLTADVPANTPPGAGSPHQESEPPRETAQPAPDTTPPEPTPQAETRPAQDTSVAAAPAHPPAEIPVPQQYTPDTKQQSKGVTVPEPGASYLQVTALPRADAEGVVKTLHEQSFPTILAASSKDGLFRVLVGPYHQTAQLADAKSRLKAMGFGSAFVYKQ